MLGERDRNSRLIRADLSVVHPSRSMKRVTGLRPRRRLGPQAAHLRAYFLRSSFPHHSDALTPVLGNAPESGPPGWPTRSTTLFINLLEAPAAGEERQHGHRCDGTR